MVELGTSLRGMLASLLTLPIALPIYAQIIPDATLSSPSSVTVTNNTFEISRGTIAGSNLFHSFSQFNLPRQAIAEFAPPHAIDTIIARVTHDTGSTIDGLLRVHGTADLYLLSPGGLNFGETARLELGGTFVGSTAAGLVFANGEVFSAIDPPATDSILSMNTPLGLQWGAGLGRSAQASIGVTGSELIAPDRLVLAGGAISLDQGAIVQGNSVEIVGSSLEVFGGSRIQSLLSDQSTDHQMDQPMLSAGELARELVDHELGVSGIYLDLSDRLTVSGFTPAGQYSGIFAQTTGSVTGGDIVTITPDVTLSDRGFIATQTTSAGNGGVIRIEADRLTVETGGQILSEATSTGNAGAIALRAHDRVTINGRSDRFRVSPFANLPSAYDLTDLDFTTDPDPNIEAADSIPHLSLARTETEIRNGDRPLATAQDAVFDYYIFATDTPNSRAIFDIDFGAGGLFDDGSPGSMGTEIFLLDYDRANLIDSSAGAFNPSLGAGGSTSNFDAYLDVTLPNPGTYVLGVGEFDSGASNSTTFEPLMGEPVRLGGTYVLQLSLESPGTPNTTPSEVIAPGVFNPNFGDRSAIFSLNRDRGHGGDITIAATSITLSEGGELSAVSFADGESGHISLNATDYLQISNGNTLVSTQTRGAGQAGDLTLNATTIDILGAARLDSTTFGTGNGGEIQVTATDSLTIDALGGERTATGIFNEVKELAIANGGNITLRAETIIVRSAKLSGTMRGIGNSGDLILDAGVRLILEAGSDLDVEVNGQAVGNGGNIILRAPQIQILDGTEIETEVDGEGSVGQVEMTAGDRLDIDNGQIQVEIDERRGASGAVVLTAPVVSITNEALIEAKLDDHAIGAGSTITITADRVEISNSTLALDADRDSIGDSGDLRIDAGTITLREGASISTSTNGSGNAGTTNLQAREAIEIQGSTIAGAVESRAIGNGGTVEITTPHLILSDGSTLQTQTEGEGHGGTILLSVGDLHLTDGAQISASTLGAFPGGNVTIQASGTIALDGVAPNDEAIQDGAEGLASAILADASGTGDAGTISLRADRLELSNGAQLRVDSDLAGLGGNLQIHAPVIQLDAAQITANAATGDQANIRITSEDLRLANTSLIATNATNTATGGNITLTTDTLIAQQNSDITANADDSFGGQIVIDALGIFGTDFRPSLTPRSDITATSALGATFSGTVALLTPDLDAMAGLVDLPIDTADPNTTIVQGCNASPGAFVVTGRGGFVEAPERTLLDLPVSYTVRSLDQPPATRALTPDPSIESEAPLGTTVERSTQAVPAIETALEASGWSRSTTGEVVLQTPQEVSPLLTPHCER